MKAKSTWAVIAMMSFLIVGATASWAALMAPQAGKVNTSDAVVRIPEQRLEALQAHMTPDNMQHNGVTPIDPEMAEQMGIAVPPETPVNNAGGPSPEGFGDATTYYAYDGWWWVSTNLNASNNWIVGSSDDPNDPDNQNPAGTWLAWAWDPTTIAAGPVFNIDSVDITFNEVSDGITFPFIRLCADTGDPNNPGPDFTNCYAEVTNHTVNLPVGDRSITDNFPGLTATITDMSQTFWVAVNLPAGTVAGLPYDVGTNYNCTAAPEPDNRNYWPVADMRHEWFSVRWGIYRYTDADPTWRRLGIWCDNAQTTQSIFNCPMALNISDATNDTTDDLMQFNNQFKYMFIRCSQGGVYNTSKYSSASPCGSQDTFSVNSDLSFIPLWATPGMLGPYMPRFNVQAWNVDVYPNKDTGLDPATDDNYTEFGVIFTGNCKGVGNPPNPSSTRWDGAGAFQFIMLNSSPQGPQDCWDAWPMVERFPTTGKWEACVRLDYYTCVNETNPPDKEADDQYDRDNSFTEAEMGCLPFTIQGCNDVIENFDSNSLFAAKLSASDTQAEWHTCDTPPCPSPNPWTDDPRDYGLHFALAKADIPGMWDEQYWNQDISGNLSTVFSFTVGPNQPLFFEVFERDTNCPLSKQDPSN